MARTRNVVRPSGAISPWPVAGPVAALIALPGGAAAGAILTGGVLWLLGLGDGSEVAYTIGGALGLWITWWPSLRAVRTHCLWAWTGTLVAAALVAPTAVLSSGESVRPVWSASHDTQAGVSAVGSWYDDGVVVRVREDTATAFQADDGGIAWSWSPPGRERICTLSRRTSGGIGVLGHTTDGKSCSAAIALDLGTGREIWRSAMASVDRVLADQVPDLIAVTGETVVLPEARGWRAIGLSDGTDRWRAASEEGCSPLLSDSDGRTVVTVDECGERAAPALATYAGRDGRRLSRGQVPAVGAPRFLMVLSAAPLTLWVHESDLRGTRAVLGYDERGDVRTTLPTDGPTGEIRILPGYSSAYLDVLEARPVRSAAVVGDTLVAAEVRPDDRRWVSSGNKPGYQSTRGRIAGFSMTSGTRLWSVDTDAEVEGVIRHEDEIWAIGGSKLTAVSSRTGLRTHEVATRETDTRFPADLWILQSGGYAVVHADGGSAAPVTVLR
ncbi:PQQ-binding-like beta-propeller repeat protein [Streptomyces sp. 2P-4]|uniref:PQQ-binding-like beta-propeller repeat protein n=1 Tax=Streptomyces sp. 2P-4 TaxID=2931974 RepID=UPI0025425E62|nr:PQQ-binding-like beta-propeller repeat protein [Streptomyces sp. 2P-4]